MKNNGIEFDFVDFKKTPVTGDTIDTWLSQVAMETLFNTRGTTYRTLKLKELNLDNAGKREWLIKENLLIKRPVIEHEGKITVAFNETTYEELFL